MHYRRDQRGYWQLFSSMEDETARTPRPLFTASSIGLLVDLDNGTLLKHGPSREVFRYYVDAKKRLENTGRGALCENWVFFDSPVFDEEELNRCLNTSGYAKTFYSKCVGEGKASRQAETR